MARGRGVCRHRRARDVVSDLLGLALLLLRDLWTNDAVFVAEAAGSRLLVVWDVLVARVHALADGSRQLEGTSLPLPPDAAAPMVGALKAEYRRLDRAEKDFTAERFFKMVAPVFHQEWYDRVAAAPPPELRPKIGASAHD